MKKIYVKDKFSKYVANPVKKYWKKVAKVAVPIGTLGLGILLLTAICNKRPSKGLESTVAQGQKPAAVAVAPSNHSPQGLTLDDYADPKNIDPNMTIAQAIQGKEAAFYMYKLVVKNMEDAGYVLGNGYTGKNPNDNGDDKAYP